MSMRAELAAVVMATCVLAACSPGRPLPGGAAPTPTTTTSSATAFCEQERAQTAAFSARCLGGAAADWKALRDGYLPCARFDELVAAGTLRYHADLAADCLKANSADRACSAPENFCLSKTLEGLVAANAPCRNDYECPGNAVCWAPAEFGFNACVQSVCTTVPDKVGDSCLDFPLCYPGVVTCFNGECAAYGADGEACGADLPDCAPGFRCDGNTLKCTAMSAGNPCIGDIECLGTEFCGPIGQCVPRIELGGSCEAASAGCVGFAACDPSTLLCTKAGHVGQACGSTTGAAILCIGGSCQDNGDGTTNCLAPLEAEQPCSIGAQCASGGCLDHSCAVCAQ